MPNICHQKSRNNLNLVTIIQYPVKAEGLKEQERDKNSLV